MIKVAMIGVGKLGQDCAEVMAEQYDVVGYDVEPRTPAFPMKPTIQEAVTNRDIIFIAAPTPHDARYGGEIPTSHLPNKDFDYTIVTDILNEVNKYVNQNQLVVLISTVLPGTVRNTLRPCITNARFIYNPYLIAMGTTKWDFINPEMLIIGTEDGSITGDAAELIAFYKPLMQNNPRLEVGTWDEAEAIKIFYNTFISTKVALVNMIQDVAERSGNINVDIVTTALAKSTHRIMGPAYMTAGMGDGGACHPRDNIALRHLADKLNLGYDLFDSIMTAREKQASNLALKCLEYGRNITIIGKAYKPGVPYINGSSSLLVGHYITNNGGSVEYHDVHTGDNYIPAGPNPVFLIGYWEQWVEEFPFPPSSIVIDPWRKIKPDSNIAKIIHYGNTREQSPTHTPIKYDSTPPWYTMQMWPELATVKDKACVLYAGRNDYGVLYLSSNVLVELVNENLSNGKEILVFDNSHETFTEDEVKKIYRILPNINIEPSNVYFIVNSSDAVVIHEHLCERNRWENPINIVVVNAFEFITKHFVKTEHDKPYVIGPREKKFLCLNRNPHWHRTCLLGLMIEQNLLDKAYYSFYDNEYCVSEISNICIKTRMLETAAVILNNIKEFQPNLPLRLTLDEAGSNPNGLYPQDASLFDNSYFSLIPETYYFTNSPLNELNTVFLTEKTYNAIIMKHPFILAAMPNSLDHLRHNGYKTFHPFINESYDDVTNDEERLKLIVTEVERLSKLSEEELIIWQENIKDIVEHNYQVLMNRIAAPLNYVRLDKNNNE